jgi:hypothetical protein
MHTYLLISRPSRAPAGMLTLALLAGAALLVCAACGSSPGNNKIAIKSVPDARLYGIGGIESAGFPNDVTVFEGPLSSSSTAAGSFSAPIAAGELNLGIAVDPTDTTGAVYVSSSAGQVCKFARPNPNATTPLFTISGFAEPNYLAFDSNGDLFVAGGTTIVELNHPITSASVPHQVISNSNGIFGLALDASNNLYDLAGTPSGSAQLQAYAPPYTAPPVVTSNGVSDASSIAYDPAANALFTVSINLGNTGGTVSGFPLPLSANASPTVNVGVTGCLGGFAFDAAGNSFLGHCGGYPSGGSVAVEGPPFIGVAGFTFASPFSLNPLITGP